MRSCFHCGLPVQGGARRVGILGAERELCCAGCEAVARTIVGAGLESYYQTRTAGAVPLPALPGIPDYDTAAAGSEASLVLQGVRCSACLWLIERTLRALPGVARADANYATQRAQVCWDPARASLRAVIGAVRSVGYDACPYSPAAHAAAERAERRAALWRLFVAGFGSMQVMMYAFPAYVDDGALTPETTALMRWASLLLTAPVLLFACRPFFSGARAELRRGRIGLDTPIALGLAGAFLASAWATVAGEGEVYFDSVAMLAFLLLGARFAESAVRRRAARALDPLLRWTASRPLAVGDEITVAPGERVPADGIVVRGASSADEALLTGEARAVRKREGDELIAGSVNLEQPVLMRATHIGAATRAAAIARLAERGLAAKPRIVQHADRIAGGLTAVVLALALGALLATGSFWSAVAVLVVACPCALALAAPAVLTRASGALLRRGMLLANAAALQPLARATDIVLDKTGTLTTGRLAVASVRVLADADRQTCLAWAAHLEAGSRHPIARAFPQGDASRVEEVRHVVGMGIEGRIGGRLLRIGSAAFCRVEGVPGDVFLVDENGALAAFRLRDELRPDAAEAVAELKRHCVVHLASGDTVEAAERMARRLGIEHARGSMTPEAKLAYVAALQARGRVVAMVGDGLNDAPVLARADVSLAMGSGADAAQLRADVVLQQDSLAGAVAARRIAHRAMRLVRQNLGWALAYNAIALPLAAAGWIGPLEAALAMGASSASVLLNALRPLAPGKEPWKASTSSSLSPSPSYS